MQFIVQHAIIVKKSKGWYAAVAQLDRVTDYESVGRGFESLLPYQLALKKMQTKIPHFGAEFLHIKREIKRNQKQ